MTRFVRFALLACLALSLLLLAAEPAFAGVGDFLRGLARRDRVIQVCVVVACLALFILLKKFDGGSSAGPEGPA